MLDLLERATAEAHRHDLGQLAAYAVIDAYPADPPEILSAADRRRLLASMGAAPAPVAAVEVADPIALWPLRTRHPRPNPWPGWRTVLDWSVWAGLCLLALAAGLVR